MTNLEEKRRRSGYRFKINGEGAGFPLLLQHLALVQPRPYVADFDRRVHYVPGILRNIHDERDPDYQILLTIAAIKKAEI